MDNFTKSILGDKSNINVSQENTKKSSDDDLDLDLELNMDLDLNLNMGKNLSNSEKDRKDNYNNAQNDKIDIENLDIDDYQKYINNLIKKEEEKVANEKKD